MPERKPNVAYLTAGAAGMFCGSCLRDNTLVAALRRLGCEAHLIPTYTPIRTDEEDVSEHRVFFGGINVYLQQKYRLFRYLPSFMDRWLDNPWLINKLTAFGMETDASMLGGLAVSMIRGEMGNQSKEIHRLVDWLESDHRPDIVNMSNLLIAGCAPMIQRRLKVPVLVTLQGDDLFLEGLTEPYKQQALAAIRDLAGQIDGFLVFSQFYADFMADYLRVPRDRFHLVSMGLNLDDFRHEVESVRPSGPPTVGYLARVCPEKGLHVLVDAFRILRTMPGCEDARLRVAGWLGASDRKFFEQEVAKIERHGLSHAFEYAGAIERKQKIEFLRRLDVLSVPTIYREPKGIFVLEALASGVPVVQPDHGAFPELLQATGGGRLHRPNDPQHLAETLHALLTDHPTRRQLGQRGRERVHRDFGAEAMARQTLDIYRRFLEPESQAALADAASS